MGLTVYEINSNGRKSNTDMEFSVVASLGKRSDWEMLQNILFNIMSDNCIGYWNPERMFKYPLKKTIKLSYIRKGSESSFSYKVLS